MRSLSGRGRIVETGECAVDGERRRYALALTSESFGDNIVEQIVALYARSSWAAHGDLAALAVDDEAYWTGSMGLDRRGEGDEFAARLQCGVELVGKCVADAGHFLRCAITGSIVGDPRLRRGDSRRGAFVSARLRSWDGGVEYSNCSFSGALADRALRDISARDVITVKARPSARTYPRKNGGWAGEISLSALSLERHLFSRGAEGAIADGEPAGAPVGAPSGAAMEISRERAAEPVAAGVMPWE